jgi:hypothetical protein
MAVVRSNAWRDGMKFMSQGWIDGSSGELAGAKTEVHTVPENTTPSGVHHERK